MGNLEATRLTRHSLEGSTCKNLPATHSVIWPRFCEDMHLSYSEHIKKKFAKTGRDNSRRRKALSLVLRVHSLESSVASKLPR